LSLTTAVIEDHDGSGFFIGVGDEDHVDVES
jgi:hypothetical protein